MFYHSIFDISFLWNWFDELLLTLKVPLIVLYDFISKGNLLSQPHDFRVLILQAFQKSKYSFIRLLKRFSRHLRITLTDSMVGFKYVGKLGFFALTFLQLKFELTNLQSQSFKFISILVTFVGCAKLLHNLHQLRF